MITDLQARKIASEWHGGGGTALYEFSSTGSIRPGQKIVNEIHGNVYTMHDRIKTEYDRPRSQSMMLAIECQPLMELLDYIVTNGPRGPQEGWSTLNW